jgi:hypothetical protein
VRVSTTTGDAEPLSAGIAGRAQSRRLVAAESGQSAGHPSWRGAVLNERSVDQPQRLRVHFDSAHKSPPAAAGSEGPGHTAGREKLQPPGPAGADDIPKA